MTDDNEIDNIHEHVDHQRWLLEHGFINDLHKDNLFMYGSIIHKDVQAVQVDINPEKKLVIYDLYVNAELLVNMDKYKQLSQATGIYDLWRFKRMLKKEGNLNLKHLLGQFVRDYCGPKWAIDLNLKDFKDYEEGFKEAEKDDMSHQQFDS